MEENRPRYCLFAFVVAALLMCSMAGGQRKLLMNKDQAGSLMMQQTPASPVQLEEVDDGAVPAVLAAPHAAGRILRQVVKTNDYGSYDPSPTMAKPRFKDIPN